MLEGCLATLISQKDASGTFELIVVNDGSVDDTADYLSTFEKTAPFPVTIVNQPNTGVAIARNRGISATTGSIIAFTDDDCLLPEDWIAKLLYLWSDAPADIAGIGGPLETFCDNNTLIAEYLRYLDEFNHLPVITPLAVRPRHISRCEGTEQIAYLRTSNASFRTDALHLVGGFDSKFNRPGGEDPDLSYRLMAVGYRLQIVPELKVRHHSRADFRAYFSSLANYVRGEFINRANRAHYPEGPIRRSYSMIPLQKLVALSLTLLFSPFNVARVSRSRGCLDRQCFLFPGILVASKLVAFLVAIVGFRALRRKSHDMCENDR